MKFYCPSYSTLVFALKSVPICDLFVISKNQSVTKFCVEMGIQHLRLSSENDLSISGMKAYRDYLISTAHSFSNEKFIFGHYGFDITGLYLMELLQHNNEVYFENRDIFIYPRFHSSFLNVFNRKFHFFILKKILWSYVLNKRFDMFETRGDSWFLGVKPDRLRENFKSLSSQQLNPDPSIFIANQENVLQKFDIPEFDILYIDDGATEVYDSSGIEAILQSVRKFGYTIAVKHHPNHTSSFINRDFYSLPEYIPVELICSMAKVATMGVFSIALLTSIQHVDTYSLVEMVPIKSESHKKIIMNLFANYSISYPKSEEDLLSQFNTQKQ